MIYAIVGDGKMGHEISTILESKKLTQTKITCDLLTQEALSFEETPHVLLDASHPDNLHKIIRYARENHCAVVIATTNFDKKQLEEIDKLAKEVPVMLATNYSIGVAVLNKLTTLASQILREDFDIEIIEKHHNQKIDAPSGTAKTLFSSANYDEEYEMVTERLGKRSEKEIGVVALRGGTLPGEHSVLFCGNDEVLELKHTAYSRAIFASGMVKAGSWLVNQSSGLYSINDLIF